MDKVVADDESGVRNSQRVQKHVLQDGDLIVLGNLSFTFRAPEEGAEMMLEAVPEVVSEDGEMPLASEALKDESPTGTMRAPALSEPETGTKPAPHIDEAPTKTKKPPQAEESPAGTRRSPDAKP